MSTLPDWLFQLVLLALGAFIVVELVTRAAISRRVWREVLRIFILMDLGARHLVQIIVPPRYVIRGACNKRGTCCTMIIGNPPRFVKSSGLLRWFAAYHRIMHNFHVVGRGPEGELVFSCGHLRDDGRCGIYRYRPLLCRNYPVLPFYERPAILPGCGFVAVPRVVDRMHPHPRLPIINPSVIVHHPTRPGGRAAQDEAEHFELVAIDPTIGPTLEPLVEPDTADSPLPRDSNPAAPDP